jgi:hypothetical protein
MFSRLFLKRHKLKTFNNLLIVPLRLDFSEMYEPLIFDTDSS